MTKLLVIVFFAAAIETQAGTEATTQLGVIRATAADTAYRHNEHCN